MEIRELAVEISDEIREYESKSYSISQHNFKIKFDEFFHSVSNSCPNNKSLSILYYILNTISKEGTVIVSLPSISKRGKISRLTVANTIKKLKTNNLIKEILVENQKRGYHKYMVNPYIVYNYRKTKNDQYTSNCDLWNLLTEGVHND